MRGFAAHDQGPSLFDILGLLAQPVDHQLEVEADRGESRVEGLGAERVGFAVEFLGEEVELAPHPAAITTADQGPGRQIGGASGRARVCQYVEISVVAVAFNKQIKVINSTIIIYY